MGSTESRLQQKESKRRGDRVAQAARDSWTSSADGAPSEPPPEYTPRTPEKSNFSAPTPIAPSSSTSSSTSSGGRRVRNYRDPAYLRAPLRQETQEDLLEKLGRYDTVLIVDDSSSMKGSRWAEAQKALSDLATLAGQYDTDGIDIHFLNSREKLTGVRDAKRVDDLFTRVQPLGATPTGEKLDALVRPYLRRIEEANKSDIAAGDFEERKNLSKIKWVQFIVITDGEATDDPAPVITGAAERLQKGDFPFTQLGIQFVQIGSSKEATRFLQMLDDDLHRDNRTNRDIVDTTPYSGEITHELLVKVLLGGINRQQDAKKL